MIQEYHITNAATARYAASIRTRKKFVVEVPTLDSAQAERLSNELTRLSQECGCNLGAAFLMASIFACAIAAYVLWKTVWVHPVASLAIASVACFVSAGIGKAIGISKAKRELRARLLALSEQLKTKEATLHGMHR